MANPATAPDSAPRRVLVVGGHGFYGRRIGKALRSIGGVEIVVGCRTGALPPGGPADARTVSFDLAKPETLEDGSRYDLVVNAADTIRAKPDATIRHVLRHGGCLLDVGADPRTTERLLAIDDRDARGQVVLGAGLFPGLSTLLAHDVRRSSGAADDALALELAILLEPLSGAGDGSCELMMEALETPSVRYESGQRVEGGTVGPIQRHRFPCASRPRRAAVLAMPDTHLLHRAFPRASVTSSLGVEPSMFLESLRALAAMLGIARRLGRRPHTFLRSSAGMMLRQMRARLLRERPTRIRMIAAARDVAHPARQSSATLDLDDGQHAVGIAVAAAVRMLLERSATLAPGLHDLGDFTTLARLVETMRSLAGPSLRIDYSSSSEADGMGNNTTGS